MKLGSLCSGAGGLDMAVEAIFGATTAWHCELNPAASKVLEYRYPGVPNHHDLINTDWSTVEPIDILCAGWPCQPFSSAGKRKGADDERAIWPYVARAIRILRPRIVVLENVSAVLGPEFQRVANSLAEVGMDVAWTCLRASDVGAPHRRERLFVVAHAQHGTGHGQWSRAESGQGDQAPTDADSGRREVGSELNGQPASDTADGDSQGRHTHRRHIEAVDLLPTPRTSDTNGAGAHGNSGPDLRTTIAMLQTPSVADALGGHLSGSGARRGEPLLPGQAREMAQSWGKYAPAIARWEAVTRPAPSPTEPNKNGNPRLSAAFSEWLMGWESGWVTDVPGISRNDQLRIVGNGVCPQQATAALRYLLSVQVAA